MEKSTSSDAALDEQIIIIIIPSLLDVLGCTQKPPQIVDESGLSG